jgi:hypothetical protein
MTGAHDKRIIGGSRRDELLDRTAIYGAVNPIFTCAFDLRPMLLPGAEM